MSAPIPITASADFSEDNQLPKIKQSFVAPLMSLRLIPFVALIFLFLHYSIAPSYRCYLMFFITYFHICISMNSQAPVTENTTVLNSIPSGSGLRKNIPCEVSPPLLYPKNESQSWNHTQPSDNWRLYYWMNHCSHQLTTFICAISMVPFPIQTWILVSNTSLTLFHWGERCHKLGWRERLLV